MAGFFCASRKFVDDACAATALEALLLKGFGGNMIIITGVIAWYIRVCHLRDSMLHTTRAQDIDDLEKGSRVSECAA